MKLKFARSIQLKTVNRLKEAGFTASLIGKKVKINVGNMTHSIDMENTGGINELVDRLKAMFRPEENIYDEPPDTAIKQKSGQFPEEKLPEGHADYILPATAKPNIDRIKQWITSVKLRGKTNEGLVEEYNELKNKRGTKDFEWWFLRYIPHIKKEKLKMLSQYNSMKAKGKKRTKKKKCVKKTKSKTRRNRKK